MPTHSEGNSCGGYWYRNGDFSSVLNYKNRAVFEIVGDKEERVYIFRGIFKIDSKSDNDKRVWHKVSDVLEGV